MQVLSSLSSIPFYAPSAGFAPTNSADVSAIASSYAESAASGKLDASASANYYPSDNPSGFISSVDLSDYATTAYVDSSVSSKLDATASSQFLTSIPSDYATTAYVDSSISGFAYESAVSAWTAKQDALTFGYDTANKISSIDGSALAGEDGLVTSLQYYTSGATSTGTGTAIGRANAGNSTGSINYYTLDFGEHSPSCITAIKYSQILITADKNSDFVTAWPLVSPDLSAFAIYKSVADTASIGSVPASASSYVGRFSTTTSDLGTGVRFNLTGNNFSSIKTGEENVLVLAYQYMPDNWGTLIVTGTTGSFVFNYENSEGYTAVSGINELGIYFDTSNCYPTSNPSGFISSVDLSNYATTAYVDSSVSSKLDASASSQFVTSTAGLATTADISGFAYESAVSAWTAKQDSLTFGYDTANNISSIDGSAIGGQGGIDSATCSAIASAYAESAASSKQDTLTFGYDDSNNISSIDGSSLAGGGGGASLPISGYDDPFQGESLASAQYGVGEMRLYHSSYIGDYEHSAANEILIYPTRISMQNATDGVATDVDIYMSSVNLWDSAASSVSSKQDTLTFGYDASNNISSIDGSALAGGGLEYGATAANGSNKLGLGASGTGTTKTDAGLYLSSTHGTGFYKVNEMTLNRSGYSETVKFNLGSAGSQVLLSASGTTRGAFHSAWNDSASASFGVSGSSAYLKLGEYTAYNTSINAWNETYGTVANNSATWGGSSYALSADVSGTVDLVDTSSSVWNTVTSKMESSAVQSAYASASATQATAQNVLYILIPDGV